MKQIKKYGIYIVYLILIVYIVIALFIPRLTMSVFGFRSFVVVSYSMEPDINKGDMIFIRKINESSLEERDIITFEVYIPDVDERSFNTHYIAEITTNTSGETIYKTQGASAAEGDYDEWEDENGNPVDITFDDIEGIYMFRIPYIGNLIDMLRDPIFLALLVVNGTIIYFLVATIKKTIKQKKDT